MEIFQAIEEVVFKKKSIKDKLRDLRQILEHYLQDLLKNENITLIDNKQRIDYISKLYDFNFHLKNNFHTFRYQCNQCTHQNYEFNEIQFFELLDFLCSAFEKITSKNRGERLLKIKPKEITYYKIRKQNYSQEIDKKVSILENDTNHSILKVFDEDDFSLEEFFVSYSEIRIFNSIYQFKENDRIQLVGLKEKSENVFTCRYIIFEPDFLLDVSAIASCFQMGIAHPYHYFKSLLSESENSTALLKGNISNMFLDNLINSSDIENEDFKGNFLESFKKNAIKFTTLKEIEDKEDFKHYSNQLEGQFNTLKQLIIETRNENRFNFNHVLLEPSFISPKYGIQGRLDFLEYDDQKAYKERKISIVELKSGKVNFADFQNEGSIPIKDDHRIQLQLYTLMIGGVTNIKAEKIDSYLLYSATNSLPLRKDYFDINLIKMALNLRNQILLIQSKILKTDYSIFDFFEKISFEEVYPNSTNGWKKKMMPEFEGLRTNLLLLNSLKKDYFNTFYKFILKEGFMTKVGESHINSNQGFSSLWNKPLLDKIANQEIEYNLTLLKEKVGSNGRSIIFKKNSFLEEYQSNFRIGDSVVLTPYLRNKENKSLQEIDSTSQILLKGKITSISDIEVEVNLNYKQPNQRFFENKPLWALQPDAIESNLWSGIRHLNAFINSDSHNCDIILGLKKPEQEFVEIPNLELVDYEKKEILQKCINSKNYFLLIGPPGTGKTSLFLKNLTKILLSQNENILLLAYTNRAVDEICEAILCLYKENKTHPIFIRLGNHLGSEEKFHPYLLSEKVENISNRQEIKKLFNNTSIYVGTVSAISHIPELFHLKTFDTIIVDEASQILEPNIISILAKSNRFIMIGDEKQLPAVSILKNKEGEVNIKELINIGLTNTKNSLFERLLTLNRKNNWKDSYAALEKQGRMHPEISDYINHQFYNSNLISAGKEHQKRNIQDFFLKSYNELFCENNKRVIFYHTEKKDSRNEYSKFNMDEVNRVVDCVERIYQLFLLNKIEFIPTDSLGIIAPFRSQIAKIKFALGKLNPLFKEITVDTVERFQGSQRDFMIISFTVSNIYQMANMVNLTPDGKVDRKLNVALSRAKEVMILIGNEKILSIEPHYEALIKNVKEKHTFYA